MIFILNRQEKIVRTLNNKGGVNSTPPFFDDVLTEDLVTGAETFQFSTLFSSEIASELVIGNYVAFLKEGKYKLFQIMQTEEIHEETMYLNVYCECAGLELINKVFRARNIPSADLRKFLTTVLDETGWNVGKVEGTSVEAYDFELEDNSVYATLQNNLSKFDVELEFRVELNNGTISNKFVDTYFRRGRVTGKRFQFGKDIEQITRNIDSTELYTALIGRGTDNINFRDVTVSGIDKPVGQDFVFDQDSYDRYNNNGYHIIGIYEYETSSPQELLLQTYKRLKEVCVPKIEYEVKVAFLGELLGEDWNKISIGDTVYVIDNAFNPPIQLAARVVKLETSMSDPESNTCTLSNFIPVQSNITDEMRKLASKLEGYVDNSIGNKFPIGGEDIQSGAIDSSHINQSTITTDHLIAGAVTAEKISADYIEAIEGQFQELKIGKAEVIELEALSGSFGILNSEFADIKTLVNGNLSSENIQAGAITGDRLNMDSIFVKDGNILDLNASKINAGEINLNKVKIKSEDGGIEIVGATQQFKDKNNKVRIQMGQDAQGEFNFILRGEDGTTTLIDHTGIKEKAIADNLIKENMIGEGEVGEKAIDYNSFVTGFNKDTNTTTLKGTKIRLDDQGQTLDVAFTSLKSQADDTKTTTESNTTEIKVQQGQIDTLITDTTIIKDGQTLKLKDDYNKTVQTVDGMKNTIGSQQTIIDQNTGKITDVEIKTNELERNVNSFSSRLSSTENTVSNHATQISQVQGAIEQAQSQIDENKNNIITVNTEISKTNSKVSNIEQNVGNINLKVSEVEQTTITQTQTLNNHTNSLNAVDEKINTAKQEAIDSSNDTTETKLQVVRENIKTNTSSINTLKDQISLKVTQTELDNLSNNLQNFTTTKITEAKSEIKLTTDGISQEVSKKVNSNEVISSINQTAESVKIKADKIQLNGATTIGDEEEKHIKIENANYSVLKGDKKIGYLGFQSDEKGGHPKLVLGWNGIVAGVNDYFTLHAYPTNTNPQSTSCAYVDMAYACVKFNDWSNVKMYGDGDIRIAPIKDLVITSNYYGGSYGGGSERTVAEFTGTTSDYYYGSLKIQAVRNTSNGYGLVLTDDHATNKCAVRVNVDSSGNRFFRPLTTDGNIDLGSGNYKWKKVYSNDGVAYSVRDSSTEPSLLSRNIDVSIDTVLDELDFNMSLHRSKSNSTSDLQLELDVSTFKNHPLSNIFLDIEEELNEETNSYETVINADMKSLLHLALYELQKCKREIQNLKDQITTTK